MEEIGIRLKKLRELNGLSQRQLAMKSGVSNAMICLIEKGRSRPSLSLLKSILDSIPLSVSEFFSRDRGPFAKIDGITDRDDALEKVFGFEKATLAGTNQPVCHSLN